MATVYRFSDCAAVHLRTGPTRYLDASTARKMAAALYRVARSIERESFSDSTCGTWQGADHGDAPAALARPPVYVVKVESYSLDAGKIGETLATVYESSHRTPRAAARRLAELINGRTARARDVARKIGPGTSGRFTVDGVALKPFRARHGV